MQWVLGVVGERLVGTLRVTGHEERQASDGNKSNTAAGTSDSPTQALVPQRLLSAQSMQTCGRNSDFGLPSIAHPLTWQWWLGVGTARTALAPALRHRDVGPWGMTAQVIS